MTFTVVHKPHVCGPKPDMPVGSRIQCDACGRVW